MEPRRAVTLGSMSRGRLIDTIRQPEADFDPELLKLSEPMGLFRIDDTQLEYHLGLVVYRAGSAVHVWENEFTRGLGKMLLETNGAWVEMLEQ